MSAPEHGEPEAPPPILGRWRNVYLLLVGQLLAVVGLLYLATRWAS